VIHNYIINKLPIYAF